MSYYDVIHYEKDKQKDSEQPDLNQRPKDISFPTTVFRYYQLSYARLTIVFLFSSFSVYLEILSFVSFELFSFL